MSKQITNGIGGLAKMKKGIDTLADAVKVTLGPKGRNVILSRGEYGLPHVTKDGVTVAKEIELEDPIENMGAQLVKEVASQVADIAGDGTTTATILTQSIVAEGYKMVMAGANPMDLKRGIDTAVRQVSKFILGNAEHISDKIENIATISANNDKEIGKLISEAFESVGADGMILIDESKTNETVVNVVEGIRIERGYVSPYLVNNTDNMTSDLENPLILVCGDKISDVHDLFPILEKVAKIGRELLIISDDLDPLVLQTLILNKMNGVIKVCAIKSPGFGDSKMELLEDISIACSAELISKDFGHDLKTIELPFLGTAKRVIVDKDSTKIIEGCGEKEVVTNRIEQLKSRAANSDNYEADKIRKRISDLSGGVATIKVGGFSEPEMKEKKDRIEDALKAVRSAIEEGIVPGGGVAYICAQTALDYTKLINDEPLGMDIIKKTLEYPIRLLCNTIDVDASSVISEIRKKGKDYGYNIREEKFEKSMIKAGIIDPAKVVRIALEKSASIAGTLLTTTVVINDI